MKYMNEAKINIKTRKKVYSYGFDGHRFSYDFLHDDVGLITLATEKGLLNPETIYGGDELYSDTMGESIFVDSVIRHINGDYTFVVTNDYSPFDKNTILELENSTTNLDKIKVLKKMGLHPKDSYNLANYGEYDIIEHCLFDYDLTWEELLSYDSEIKWLKRGNKVDINNMNDNRRLIEILEDQNMKYNIREDRLVSLIK